MLTHGNIFVISAPSGAGKSSLVKELCKLDAHIKVSISHTTRNIRVGEKEAVDYYFVSQATFAHMLQKDEFLEHANVYGNYYGTNKNSIQNFLDAGDDIILEIDWQGAQQVRNSMPSAILIYIMPPNINELGKRLRGRNTDSEDVIQKRLSLVNDDISHSHEFDYIVTNDNFKTALNELYSIICNSRT